MRTKRPFALCIAVGVAAFCAVAFGCGSSDTKSAADDQNEKDRAQAKSYYVTRVHVALGDCLGCHAGGSGPRFMADGAEES